MSAVTAWPQNPVSAPLVNWCGHSGRYYTLRCDDLENFHLTGDGLFVLGAGNIALWVGTAADVIESGRPAPISSARESTAIALTGFGVDTASSWNASSRRRSDAWMCFMR